MKEKIEKILERTAVGKTEKIDFAVYVPEREEMGHYATGAALKLAKTLDKNPLEIAGQIAAETKKIAPRGFFEKIEVAPPGFVNFWISPSALQKEIVAARKQKGNFGKQKIGRGRKIIAEYSSPNIAKEMHVGHFRSTVIGDALANIYDFLGYKVVRWNYLGDWGTQFGKLIAAYKLWGNAAELKKNPIKELLRLYVLFHKEAEKNPELEKEGRLEFQKLEKGDAADRKLWREFRGDSLKSFNKIYKRLGVKFNIEEGEASLEQTLSPLIKKLEKEKIAAESEGALIIPLEKFGLPPALIRKSDGSTLYLTREIAGLEYRLKKYRPEKILYVVSNEQALHFEQFFAAAKILNLDKSELVHVKFGLVLGEKGTKFSTRKGESISLEELLDKSVALARRETEKRNPLLPEREKSAVAEAVGIGALKYNDLRENRHSDIVFDWERMLDFSGDSAPYLQYTYARLKSILRKAVRPSSPQAGAASSQKIKPDSLNGELESRLMRKILDFPDIVCKIAENNLPNYLAKYVYELAVAANKFYEDTPILSARGGSEENRGARLLLIETAAQVLKNGLGLLGIKVLERM